MRSDQIARAIIGDNEVMALVAISTNTVEEGRQIHKTYPTPTAAFGRALTIVGMMGVMMKGKERISLQFVTTGKISDIYVQANAEGHVRGYIKRPDVDFPFTEEGKLNVEGAVTNDGFLYVVKDFGFGEPFVGSTPLRTGGIATDVAHYFTVSEGIPSAVGAGVLVAEDGHVISAGGFIVQPIAGADEKILGELEENIRKMDPISRMIAEGASEDDILSKISGNFGYEITKIHPLKYRCYCSYERARRALLLLDLGELMSILKEDHGAEVKCEFCGKIYNFTESDIEEIIKEKTRKYPRA